MFTDLGLDRKPTYISVRQRELVTHSLKREALSSALYRMPFTVQSLDLKESKVHRCGFALNVA